MAPTRLKPRARSGNQRQRPSTMIDVDENLETRRERNRKAQHLFRVRKHAALASQKKLLGRLEDTVEQLTATFLSLTDAVLQSPGLSQDPGLIVKLRAATNNVIILVGDLHTPSSDSERAQTIEEDDQAPDDLVCSDSVSPPIVEDRASNSTIDCNLAHHNLSSSDNVSYATSDERGTSSIAKPERFSASTTSPVNDDPITKLTSERVSILTHTPDLNSPTAPLITNAFGNGWTSIPPSVVRRRQLDRIAGRYQPHVGTLSAMIARAALQHAYDTMLNARDISTAAVKRIFEFPLRFLSREEILMGLRWYLRPGSRDMPQLASAPFDGAMEFYTDSYVADLLPITAEPTYSQQIRPQLNSSAAHFSNQFMNAHEIEQHLWTA
ncbi:hypothetical protein F5884DRAFT_9054 [Xylogone sp. PMI_703]|nr:hypothetical protein F5884DRAFT_9054 [Xylogone sp. PMI_703]